MKLHSSLIRLAAVAVILSATLAGAATFTVTSAGDTFDPFPGDGICGYPFWPYYLPCTLRAAIQEANATATSPTTINFNIATFPQGTVPTITPGSALPAIVRPVSIDGTTQGWLGGPHRVEINGVNVRGGYGLLITAGSSRVRGLVINRFAEGGIALDSRGGNVLDSNFIGTNADGTAALGNGTGVFIMQARPTIRSEVPAPGVTSSPATQAVGSSSAATAI
jgi:CSLREA domain-containing protein